jgi:mannobiose 2-epimerase
VYLQAFGVYALSEYFRATGEVEAKARAIELYRTIDAHAYDPVDGGYFEAYSRDWKRQRPDEPSIMGHQVPKSQNTHLHLMEAFTALLRIWPDEGLKTRQRQLIDLMLTRIFDPVHHHLYLFQDEKWKPLSDEISFGHDIEASWLLPEAAGVLGEPAMVAKCNRAAVEIARITLKEGIDPDGGVINTAGPHGYIDTRKDWWPQAEAVVGFLNAYELSHDAPFFAAAQKSWRFIDQHVVDHVKGEWFETLTREGKPVPRPKASLWKCPYHNGRMCMEVIERAHALASAK